MSEIKTVHTVRVPDVTLLISITMDEGDCDVIFEDFVSPEKKDSQDHDAIKVLEKSIMEGLLSSIASTLRDMGHLEDTPVEHQEGNVVYLKTPLSQENDDA